MEIYTDVESKIDKYRNLLGFLGIIMLPVFIFIVENTREALYGWISVIRAINFLLFVLYVYTFVKIWHRINQLKRL